ncbi:MAG: TIGR02147 family protein [Deltaproteobacteria bacterium]|nr:TIGR02147 family protein [Deltaproteobacteria bacterium]
MSPRQKEPLIYDYKDYRAFLRDWYDHKKSGPRGYSYRSFSLKAGFTSPNFLKLVMDGDRNLTESSLSKFAKGLALNKGETEFFINLVRFNQSKTHEERDQHYQKLLSSRRYNQLKPLEKEFYEYYSQWYHPIVRELVAHPEFNGTPEWISKRIFPQIPVEDARDSLDLLLSLGFVTKSKQGCWAQSSALITTGPESQEMALLKYHQNLLQLAKHVLPQIEQERRDVSALTLGLAKCKVPQLKKMVQEFRKQVLEFVSDDVHPEEVVQLSIQLLPLTRPKKPRGKA